MVYRKALRPGEAVSTAPIQEDAAVQFIGNIETPWETSRACPKQGDIEGPDCTLILRPDWGQALTGLDRFASLDILYWLHQSPRDLLLQSPKKDGFGVGTFALRSPARPNPIGVSRVVLRRMAGNRVVVGGLDCINGTPLLDIKPVHCAHSSGSIATDDIN